MTCPGWFNMELPNEASFPFSNCCYDHCKTVARETYYSFLKIMEPISRNYIWENGVKQIKTTEQNLSQSCILCQFLRTKTLASGSKSIKHVFFIFNTICSVDVIYLTCLVFLKSPWWLGWIFCAPTPLI